MSCQGLRSLCAVALLGCFLQSITARCYNVVAGPRAAFALLHRQASPSTLVSSLVDTFALCTPPPVALSHSLFTDRRIDFCPVSFRRLQYPAKQVLFAPLPASPREPFAIYPPRKQQGTPTFKMMKLTVAFLASLAAVDAAQPFRQRHVRRAVNTLDFGNGYQTGETPSSVLHGTGVPSSTVTPESSALPSETDSSTVAQESSTAESSTAESSTTCTETESSVMATGSGTGAPVYPTAYPTGETPYGNSTDIVEKVTSTTFSTTTLTITAEPTESVMPTGREEEVITSSEEVTHTVTETLTYTVGTGTSAHPVTTEITSTSTETIYKTITVTRDSAASDVPEVPSDEELELTSTLTSTTTSTTTRYVTVRPTPAESGVLGDGRPAPTGGAGEEECLPPVTVTITEKETVTVTEAPYIPSATAPYPTGNGTDPLPTGGVGSTGFLTSTKTSEAPTSDVAETPASETPASETPVSETPASETPASETPIATPTDETPSGETPSETSSGVEEPTLEIPNEQPEETPAPAPPAESDAYGPGYGAYRRRRSGRF
ncbi:hypothetical protein M011DRAFT_129127 [Sporormia fimetaria CBS 119925]|uniref:Uncharacterized protein n=1 Tax=Sporormia fimetaria CBS 119925 TaxID=1340428 RepID=A0A6A6V4M2_9PLEO|nr:hypothetical protein M011DRAFT_129127 [Sporormia fimetaria CBS 119925]